MTDPTPALSSPPNVTPYTTPARAVRRWNVLAIVSLITGLLALGIVAVVAGHIALRQIRRSGESGRGFAVAGLVLGYLGIVALGVAVAVWLSALSAGTLILTA
jgi:peptidyl-prolyl cis-trans isomerase B (cyclophilin B)